MIPKRRLRVTRNEACGDESAELQPTVPSKDKPASTTAMRPTSSQTLEGSLRSLLEGWMLAAVRDLLAKEAWSQPVLARDHNPYDCVNVSDLLQRIRAVERVKGAPGISLDTRSLR